MTKIDIFSGFLGAGKTTLIKKLIAEAYAGEKLVLIENEFGEIAIDGGFLQDAGIEISEMNSGCICCSLVGDFRAALKKVLAEFRPDRILIEPSGVGKLSDVIRAVRDVGSDELQLNSFTTVVDAAKCKMYMKNFGEFFNNQVENANCILLSRTDTVPEARLAGCVALLRVKNPHAPIVTTPWDELTGAQILETMEQNATLERELCAMEEDAAACGCGHHHDHEHGHEHAHGHEHGHDCGCGHHHDHAADDVFRSWGAETPQRYTEAGLRAALAALEDAGTYGTVLRAKGIVPAGDGGWLHFDFVPGEADVRSGGASVTGRICVIGSGLQENALKELFRIE